MMCILMMIILLSEQPMTTIQSKTDKRLIVDVVVNGRQLPMLIDTGATVGLISDKIEGLTIDRKRQPVKFQGLDGVSKGRRCYTIATLAGKIINQFLVADIEEIQESILQETGITIYGIVGLQQMRFIGMIIDTQNNTITI